MSDILIGDHQTCGISGRRMSDNICLLRDIIEDARRRGIDLNVILADQNKAFDSVSHNYLFGLLKVLNLGDFMFKNIKRLYKRSHASIIVNKYRTDEINIESGIKQGCALSMMLYVIAIEELFLRVKNNKDIKGYVVNYERKVEVKITSYADDVTVYTIHDKSSEEFFSEFNRWSEISGASLNKDKTQYIKIRKNDTIPKYRRKSYEIAHSE